MKGLIDFEVYHKRIKNAKPFRRKGRVLKINGLLIESLGPPASIGDLCYIHDNNLKAPVSAEILGFEGNHFFLMPYGSIDGLSPGFEVSTLGEPLKIGLCPEIKGRILNGIGQPIDGKGEIVAKEQKKVVRSAPNALSRKRIKEPLRVGVKAIDGCIPIGKGQRIGLFSGSGVGKSTLLGMMAKGSESDINVLALIGERGREVKEFIEEILGEEGLKKSVLVVVTSDEPALMKIKGAYTATTIAEYFRDKGLNVLLMMDSITRFAMAQREIGLSLGEPPTSKGYTPSIFSMLPKLLERSGMGDKGSITAFYNVLVDADDFNEPISDACRSILDGHIVLTRRLASLNHYPAIHILESISRLADDVSSKEHITLSRKIKEMLAVYEEAEDLINIGAYVNGSNPKIDEAIKYIDKINSFLKQDLHELDSFDKTYKIMSEIFAK